MRRKLLTTTLLSMSLLSLNLSAAGKMKCTGTHCIIDLSDLAPKKKGESPKKSMETKSMEKPSYETVILDEIETIVFSRYVMTQDEVAEYDLEQMKKMEENLLRPSLESNDLPTSEYLCEDNLKPIKVAGLTNTYDCEPTS